MLSENALGQISNQMQEPQWILNKRVEAFNQFVQERMPMFKYGIGIYVDVSSLDMNELEPLESNGDISVKAPRGIKVLNFSQALNEYGNLIKEYFLEEGKEENKLTLLHKAFFNNGKVIVIPKGFEDKEPIYLDLHLSSRTSIENLLVIAEENSEAVIIENAKSVGADKQRFRSQVVKVIVKKNSRVEFISIQDFDKNVYNFCRRNASVDSGGFFYWVDCGIGSKLSQIRTSTDLIGLKAESKSWGVVFGDKGQCYDIDCTTNHVASETISDMLTRVVLNDKARAVYRGLVKINPNAINCEGYQKDDTILLSDDAKADVVPNLEISNNDVKCSHGATVSQIDEDKLFYMMTRGLDVKSAKKAIVEGFFEPIVAKILDEELREKVFKGVSERLEVVY
jgi:Fe-S cluster assembly protein SufD